ncbi:MAG: hypothetical protein KJO69_07715 [Gammaproteobacteria bacterium]|nr:hypothetical protein [Gammaproteobacteria bacterium]
MKYPMNKDELNDWAADNFNIGEDAEGGPAESLLSGWINAMDIQDERKGAISDEEFIEIAYSEFRNMGHDK